MKKFFKKLQDKANSLAIKAKCAVESTKGEGYIDTGVKIIIGVVVGAVILAGLYALFDNVIRSPPFQLKGGKSGNTISIFNPFRSASCGVRNNVYSQLLYEKTRILG